MVFARIPAETEEPLGLIMGKQAGSRYEWYVARALWKFRWTFDYQVAFLGGRLLKGGQVVDFVVHTQPLPTPLYVYGEYWHGGTRQERDTYMRQVLVAELGGRIREPVVFEGEDCNSQDVADQSVLRVFGRAG